MDASNSVERKGRVAVVVGGLFLAVAIRSGFRDPVDMREPVLQLLGRNRRNI